MKGMTAFACMSDIREHLIEESLELFEQKTAAPVPKPQSAFSRFINSGWGVAAVCALVSVFVMGGIIWAGFNPPSGRPDDPVTETQEERESNPEETTAEPEVITIDSKETMPVPSETTADLVVTTEVNGSDTEPEETTTSQFTPVGDREITWDPEVSGKITLDGNLSDWTNAGYSEHSITTRNLFATFGTPDPNFKITTYHVSDADYLYMAFRVTDTDFIPSSDPDNFRDGDTIQLAIDFNHMLRRSPGDPLTNIFYSFDCITDAPLIFYRNEKLRNQTETLRQGDGMMGVGAATDDGWCAEIAMSWSMIYEDFAYKAPIESYTAILNSENDLRLGMTLYYTDHNESGLVSSSATFKQEFDDHISGNNGMSLVLKWEEGVDINCEGIITPAEPEETTTDSDTTTEPEVTTTEPEETTTEPETEAETEYEWPVTPSKYFEFNSNGDGTCSVSAIPTCSGVVVIPSVSPEGDRVTSIRSFSRAIRMGSIIIPEGVTSIGGGAFSGCRNLQSVRLPDGVTSIGARAFSSCISLWNITIPNSVTEIGKAAFEHCTNLTEVTLSDNVTVIGESMFDYCKALTKVNISNGVTYIGKRAFAECQKLTDVSIPDSVTYIGEEAFYNCHRLTDVSIPDGVTEIGKETFYDCLNMEKLSIGNGVTHIGEGAFYGCSSLKRVTFPDSVTGIGDSAFAFCYSLTSVTIPDGVIGIGRSAFHGCSSLTSITVPNSVTDIGDSAFDDCYKLIEICNRSSLPIETGSESNGYIGYYAKHIITDESDSYLKTVNDFIVYDDGTDAYLMGYIGNNTEITLPSDYELYDFVFVGNKKLTSVTIPDGVTTIGDHAFDYCFALKTVIIGSDVTTIDEDAFTGSIDLAEVYYVGTAEEWEKISIALGNYILTNYATRYYYIETKPTEPGNYWYYENGVPTKW